MGPRLSVILFDGVVGKDARSRSGSTMPMSAALAFVAVFGCVPYEYADPEVARNASMRFGAPYELHATPPPRLSLRCDCGAAAAVLQFTASFHSCGGDALGHDPSPFSLTYETDARLGTVLVARRTGPSCSEDASSRYLGVNVSLPLPAELLPRQPSVTATQRMLLGFPPGSEYELYLLDAAAVFRVPPCKKCPISGADPAKFSSSGGLCSSSPSLSSSSTAAFKSDDGAAMASGALLRYTTAAAGLLLSAGAVAGPMPTMGAGGGGPLPPGVQMAPGGAPPGPPSADERYSAAAPH